MVVNYYAAVIIYIILHPSDTIYQLTSYQNNDTPVDDVDFDCIHQYIAPVAVVHDNAPATPAPILPSLLTITRPVSTTSTTHSNVVRSSALSYVDPCIPPYPLRCPTDLRYQLAALDHHLQPDHRSLPSQADPVTVRLAAIEQQRPDPTHQPDPADPIVIIRRAAPLTAIAAATSSIPPSPPVTAKCNTPSSVRGGGRITPACALRSRVFPTATAQESSVPSRLHVLQAAAIAASVRGDRSPLDSRVLPVKTRESSSGRPSRVQPASVFEQDLGDYARTIMAATMTFTPRTPPLLLPNLQPISTVPLAAFIVAAAATRSLPIPWLRSWQGSAAATRPDPLRVVSILPPNRGAAEAAAAAAESHGLRPIRERQEPAIVAAEPCAYRERQGQAIVAAAPSVMCSPPQLWQGCQERHGVAISSRIRPAPPPSHQAAELSRAPVAVSSPAPPIQPPRRQAADPHHPREFSAVNHAAPPPPPSCPSLEPSFPCSVPSGPHLPRRPKQTAQPGFRPYTAATSDLESARSMSRQPIRRQTPFQWLTPHRRSRAIPPSKRLRGGTKRALTPPLRWRASTPTL